MFVDTVDSITPDKVRGLRDMLNSSAMDIMYYTSPLYRDEVSVSGVLCSNIVNVLRFRPSPPSISQRGLGRASARCSLKTQRKQSYKERPCLKTRREVHGGSH